MILFGWWSPGEVERLRRLHQDTATHMAEALKHVAAERDGLRTQLNLREKVLGPVCHHGYHICPEPDCPSKVRPNG